MPGHRKRRQFKQTDAFTRGMVIGLKRAGWSIRRIAADTHLGASTVHRLWRRWLEQGNVAIYRNVGATRVTSARLDRRILRQAVAAPQATCTAILQHVQDTLDHSISTRNISRRLVANGLHSCRPLRRLPLTPPNRRQRLEWCRARSTWMTEWHRVVFSDESRFCLSSDSRRVRVWRRRGERSNPAAIVERPTVRQRGIMVWGAIAYDSRSPLLRIQGTMTAQRYVDDVLRPVTLPYLQGVPNALYQQNNARSHTARISQQALQDVQMLPWPPYSPDLSPIEHVWDIIGRRLHALPQPPIPQDAIHTLIDSLPRRVAACIAISAKAWDARAAVEPISSLAQSVIEPNFYSVAKSSGGGRPCGAALYGHPRGEFREDWVRVRGLKGGESYKSVGRVDPSPNERARTVTLPMNSRRRLWPTGSLVLYFRDDKVIGFGLHSGEEIIDIPEEYQSPECHERTFRYGKKPMAFYLKKDSNRFVGVPNGLIQWYANGEFDKIKLIKQDMQEEEMDLADSTMESILRTMANQQRLMTDFLLTNKSEIRVGRPVKMDVATFDGRNVDPKIWIKVYENICENNGWVRDKARINGMRSYLSGSALLWFDNKYQDEEEYCWKDWKQEFMGSFNENPIVSYDHAFNWRYRGGSLVEYFYQKQGKMRLGMPGLSEELLIIGIIHGLPQHMQEQLATANIKCKQSLLKLLENIRPSARTPGTVKKPVHFTENSDTRLYHAENDGNGLYLSKKLTSMGSPIPWSKSTIFSICDSPHSLIDVTINSHLVKAYLDSGSSLNLIHENLTQKNKWKTYPTKTLINTINQNKFTATEAIDLVLEAGEQTIKIQAIVLPDMPFDLLIGKPTLKSMKVKWDFFTDQISFFSETGPNLVTRRDVEVKYPSLCKRTSPIISKFEVDFGLQENFRVVSAKPYRLENTKRNWLNVKIRSMLSEGIIRPSNSAFASPCIVIPKKNGDYRLCVDYRRINDETLLDPFPFPRIDDIINVFGGCRFFSKLDLKDGFWQLGVSENTRKYTAFVTPSGHYEFLKLPFGWKNSPAKFQRIMTTILGDLLGDKVVAYIDDICCGGYTQEDCSILTHRILERLTTAGLVLNLDKCQFCVPRIDLLGRVIDGDTKKIRAEVTEKVRNMKRPYNLRSLQCFTGLTNHFRTFIKDYAHIVRPLDKLKGKDVTFEWDSECETAYQKLIALITEEPILRVPDGRLPFELSTDASYYGTGAILYQRDLQKKRCKQLRVISYYSYTFTKAEQNYSVTEKECLAVLKAVKHFRSYLESRPFVVHTDHRALTQLLSCGELRDRLARWQLFLRSFNIIINHRSGKKLRDADALSRLCVSVPDKSDEQTFWLKHKALELEYDEQRKSYLVTPEQVPGILGLYHDDPKSGGHSGFWRTYYTIKNRFWWRNMKGDIRRYVQTCSTCQKVKAKYRSTSDQMSLPVQSHVPFHTVHVDFAELKKKSEHLNSDCRLDLMLLLM
ncbi:K02A2.6-like [Cordylochernes scorpioides]|uniref:RNA-directed DNA polymerase n=1 Tax=Cordylochernes scorpioides TaxID=51811 RepID=A0ABY6KWI2_9ARAC|nr:K02A2.6-like [Cordylochernes scorpioides]